MLGLQLPLRNRHLGASLLYRLRSRWKTRYERFSVHKVDRRRTGDRNTRRREQKRDFTYVDDIAAGTVLAIRNLGFEVINLGSATSVSLNEIIGVMERRTGKRAKIACSPPHPSDIKVTLANIDKAKRVLDWEPCFDIETGIENSLRWYNANRALAQSIEV